MLKKSANLKGLSSEKKGNEKCHLRLGFKKTFIKRFAKNFKHCTEFILNLHYLKHINNISNNAIKGKV